jgi:hypothetical protein
MVLVLVLVLVLGSRGRPVRVGGRVRAGDAAHLAVAEGLHLAGIELVACSLGLVACGVQVGDQLLHLILRVRARGAGGVKGGVKDGMNDGVNEGVNDGVDEGVKDGVKGV